MLTAEELDRLEAVAREATPGPWITDSALKPLMVYSTGLMWDVYDEGVPAGQTPSFVCNCGESSETQRHIAACDPQTILALVEMARRVEAAEADAKAFRLMVDNDICVEFGSCLDDTPVVRCGQEHHREHWPEDANYPNSYVATRRAIEKAAAAIAAAKKEQGNG